MYCKRYLENKRYDEQVTNIDDLEKIPLPNEVEQPSFEEMRECRCNPLFNINKFLKNITLDEIILIGVIFILFEEGLADDLLIIILIYLLFAGKK